MREPGEDDDTPLSPGFIDELKRLDTLNPQRKADSAVAPDVPAVDAVPS